MRVRHTLATALVLLASCSLLPARAQDDANSAQPDTAAELDRKARDAAERHELPLTPEGIERLAHKFNETHRAQEQAQQASIALPVTRSVNIALGPGGATPIVQAVQG